MDHAHGAGSYPAREKSHMLGRTPQADWPASGWRARRSQPAWVAAAHMLTHSPLLQTPPVIKAIRRKNFLSSGDVHESHCSDDAVAQ